MLLAAGEARRRFAAARVARLATADAGGVPHLVPVTFALTSDADDDEIVTVVDAKPKRSLALRRLRNIAENPRVCLLADDYAEDWTRLWWARADGDARILTAGPAREAGIARLAGRYPQYRAEPPPGPLIVITVSGWSGWAAQG